MAKSVTDVALANIRAKIAALRMAEAELIEASELEVVPEVPKAKRGRGKAKAKPGLPAEPDPFDEAARLLRAQLRVGRIASAARVQPTRVHREGSERAETDRAASFRDRRRDETGYFHH